MAGRNIVVVGASAGGVEALVNLVRGIPANLPVAVFVVLHVPANATSLLPQILTRAGLLPAAHATDGAPIVHGQIVVAPPDHHLLIERDGIRLSRGPRENRSRPAVDPLFRSAARAFGPRAVGVVLSGSLDDGTSGLAAIKARGGVGIVQDPAEAVFPSMPLSAIEHVAVDHRLPASQIGPLLA
ncbi:MAG: chemotaxis protein CheB, partial [Chloroflexota bacterium]|nr:chemotaxis protein CheB [Chloroflexota bacterium]